MLMHMNLSLSRKRKMRIIEGARLAMALPAVMYYVNLQLIFLKCDRVLDRWTRI